jgi:hypothetical protein
MAKKRTTAQPIRVTAGGFCLRAVDDLIPYAGNAKVHPAAQLDAIRASLREFGFVSPVLIDDAGNIIAGHGRVLAAKAEGMAEIPCVLANGLTDAQRKAYILADNRLAEMATWDMPTLRIELEGLQDLQFDTSVTGFDMASLKEIEVSAHTRARSGSDSEHFWGNVATERSEEYESFVEKFKHQLTTDDCWTPPNIYETVRDWAVRRYGLDGCSVIRPFFPGGNYIETEYPADSVVIDNPPFSIISEICRFYDERGIRFFLFAPALTLFSIASGSCSYLPCGVPVTYENGATVNTSFVTNLSEYKIEVSPGLYQAVKDANDKNLPDQRSELPNYVYPDCVASVSIFRLAKYGQALNIRAADALFVRSLDAQKAVGKALFGGGFLLSEKAAAEKAAAEKAAAEKAAAITWALSEREIDLVCQLAQADERMCVSCPDQDNQPI